jgi:dGTPase
MNNWQQLLNSSRRRIAESATKHVNSINIRTELERDYDRILFSAPLRRLSDKTQVFPLEKNDSVRNRLTHSHEVSNLARSIGINLAFNHQFAESAECSNRNVPALLAAIGLAHDIGNPPFGHQGEMAIRKWFEDNYDEVFDERCGLSKAMKSDFLRFEGNAQTFRILTRLQLINDDFGLNLTYATLAALLKYPVPSDEIDCQSIVSKKHGFFQSEKEIVNGVWQQTGLQMGVRHPLTYVMESCDDIAYSVCDTEDTVKKGLVSFTDVIAYLKHEGKDDPIINIVCQQSENKYFEYRREDLAPAELNDISMQMFRVCAISIMVQEITKVFLEFREEYEKGYSIKDLMSRSRAKVFCDTLKQFNYKHAYQHKTVLKVELTGYNAVADLMDMLWYSITDREDKENPASMRNTPFSKFAYGRISENYRRVFESPKNEMPIRYRELQLLTDMVSGMTDSYLISLCDELKSLVGGQ